MLKQVTLTGIDNRTDVGALSQIQKEYPFVEFGMLISSSLSNQNTNRRYPHLTLLKRLKGKNLNLSCHICGTAARAIVTDNDWSEVQKLVGTDLEIFQRIQLNIGPFRRFSRDIEFFPPWSYLLQLKRYPACYEFYRDKPNVFGFQDNSGGTGIYSADWMNLDDRYFGYGGGLGPENCEEAIRKIAQVHPGDFWIDMESSLRSSNDWFDLERCRAVLEICQSFIQEQELSCGTVETTEEG